MVGCAVQRGVVWLDGVGQEHVSLRAASEGEACWGVLFVVWCGLLALTESM